MCRICWTFGELLGIGSGKKLRAIMSSTSRMEQLEQSFRLWVETHDKKHYEDLERIMDYREDEHG